MAKRKEGGRPLEDKETGGKQRVSGVQQKEEQKHKRRLEVTQIEKPASKKMKLNKEEHKWVLKEKKEDRKRERMQDKEENKHYKFFNMKQNNKSKNNKK